MLLWFAGMSVLGVLAVFQSPGVDYRFVMAGSVLPVAEGFLGHPFVLHTLLGAVVVLGLTIVTTRSHRVLRRRLLGFSLGLFAHLVLDLVWARSRLFWWPFLGWSFGRSEIPELSRGPLGFVLELIGLAALGWCWHRFGLADAGRRHRFLTTGRLGS
ncbi:MAG: metal-dependent hydrolase [Actinomycetota bacterium]|nr:metal-dependent hydrolase [Actinomycetota bacterium]